MVTRTYEVRTHGCQMNVHDSERIAGLLDEAGYAPVADGAQPDVVVFSTCPVRENADNKLAGNLSHLKPARLCLGCVRWQHNGLPIRGDSDEVWRAEVGLYQLGPRLGRRAGASGLLRRRASRQ